jgi:5'-3' exonuclease
LYGFLTSLAKTIRETRADRIVICQDRKPYLRSVSYPQYKQLRKKNADDELLMMFNQSMKLVLEALETLGFPVWGIDGFESDDLVGHCVVQHRSRFSSIYAASNDSDLFQLLWCDRFFVYKDSITSVVSGNSLLKKTGLTPEQFMLATALQGTHNDIEGIPRVGEKRAIEAVKDPSILRKYQDKYKDIIDRNLALIKLPHPQFPPSSVPKLAHRFNAQALYRFCGRYDIDVTKSMLDSFDNVGRMHD